MKKKVFISNAEDHLVSLVEIEMKHEDPKVVACEVEKLVPFNARLAAADIRKRKRNGEYDWSERQPKKRTLDQLRKQYVGKTRTEIMEDNYQLNWRVFDQTSEPKPLEVLVQLCEAVASKGDGFENLHTEWDRAKATASEIAVLATQIKDVIENHISQEDARLAKKILGILDVRYRAVLADNVRNIKFEETDLYSWMRNQQYSNKHLDELIRREDLIQAIFKYSPR